MNTSRLQNCYRRYIILVCLTALPWSEPVTVFAQTTEPKKDAATSPGAPALDNVAAVQTERDQIQKKLDALDLELSGAAERDAETMQGIRSDYLELLSIFDIHLMALTEAKRLAENSADADEQFLQEIKELKKDTAPNSFSYLLRLESAFLDSRDELTNLQKAIAQRQSEVEKQTQLASDLSKKLRLEREKKAEVGASPWPVRWLEVRQQIARASAAQRKVEIENLTVRQAIEQQEVDRLHGEIVQIQAGVLVSEEALKKLTNALDEEEAKINAEVQTRQRELNRELTHAFVGGNEATKRLGRLYTDLLSVYLSVLRSKLDMVEFEKRILKKRFELRSGSLAQIEILQFQQELRKVSSAADIDIVAQNQSLSDIIAELASRQDTFLSVENFPQINEKFRTTLRYAMGALSEIGKFSKAIKYLRDSGDFSKTVQSRGSAALASFQSGVATIWNFEVFVIEDSPITLGKLLLALLLFLIGIRISRFLASRFQKQLGSHLHFDPGAAVAFETISFYALVIIWAIISLQFARIPLTIFTLAGGALAIGVGFGSQTIVKNFFSGMILLLERPIRVGDLVQYDTIIGTVSRIGTRSTIILTAEQLEVIIPNSYLIENSVTNLTLSSNRMRRSISIGVAYSSPLRDVGQIILQQVERHKLVLKDPAPDVIFSAFGDSALEFTLRFWVNVGGATDAKKIESDLRHLICSAFRDAGIVMPFPKRDVQLSTADPLKIRVVNDEVPPTAGKAS